ncbi:unnamed protein product [Polarella glacialis]|uniref:Uncharacterized protein n=1 Tax=Polarella glacialis TaxID=89957 RepID=A0A813H2U3_POLGL|nr:unnamed protein product [Polarella glacialis]
MQSAHDAWREMMPGSTPLWQAHQQSVFPNAVARPPVTRVLRVAPRLRPQSQGAQANSTTIEPATGSANFPSTAHAAAPKTLHGVGWGSSASTPSTRQTRWTQPAPSLAPGSAFAPPGVGNLSCRLSIGSNVPRASLSFIRPLPADRMRQLPLPLSMGTDGGDNVPMPVHSKPGTASHAQRHPSSSAAANGDEKHVYGDPGNADPPTQLYLTSRAASGGGIAPHREDAPLEEQPARPLEVDAELVHERVLEPWMQARLDDTAAVLEAAAATLEQIRKARQAKEANKTVHFHIAGQEAAAVARDTQVPADVIAHPERPGPNPNVHAQSGRDDPLVESRNKFVQEMLAEQSTYLAAARSYLELQSQLPVGSDLPQEAPKGAAETANEPAMHDNGCLEDSGVTPAVMADRAGDARAADDETKPPAAGGLAPSVCTWLPSSWKSHLTPTAFNFEEASQEAKFSAVQELEAKAEPIAKACDQECEEQEAVQTEPEKPERGGEEDEGENQHDRDEGESGRMPLSAKSAAERSADVFPEASSLPQTQSKEIPKIDQMLGMPSTPTLQRIGGSAVVSSTTFGAVTLGLRKVQSQSLLSGQPAPSRQVSSSSQGSVFLQGPASLATACLAGHRSVSPVRRLVIPLRRVLTASLSQAATPSPSPLRFSSSASDRSWSRSPMRSRVITLSGEAGQLSARGARHISEQLPVASLSLIGGTRPTVSALQPVSFIRTPTPGLSIHGESDGRPASSGVRRNPSTINNGASVSSLPGGSVAKAVPGGASAGPTPARTSADQGPDSAHLLSIATPRIVQAASTAFTAVNLRNTSPTQFGTWQAPPLPQAACNSYGSTTLPVRARSPIAGRPSGAILQPSAWGRSASPVRGEGQPRLSIGPAHPWSAPQWAPASNSSFGRGEQPGASMGQQSLSPLRSRVPVVNRTALQGFDQLDQRSAMVGAALPRSCSPVPSGSWGSGGGRPPAALVANSNNHNNNNNRSTSPAVGSSAPGSWAATAPGRDDRTLPPFFYEADTTDPMDVALLQDLVALNLEVSARLNIIRLRPGKYKVEGGTIRIVWQDDELLVRARPPRRRPQSATRSDGEESGEVCLLPEGSEMKLSAFLRQLANVGVSSFVKPKEQSLDALAAAYALLAACPA